MVADLAKRNEELERELEELRAVSSSLQEKLSDSERQRAHLEFQLDKLRRMLFGRRSEKLPAREDGLKQLELFEEAEKEIESELLEEDDSGDSAGAGRRGRGRRIPKEIHRERIEVDVDPELRNCPDCGEAMQLIGEDISETLEYVPALLFVLEYALKKYACKRCQSGVIQAKRPPRPIARSRPGPGLLAYLLVAKYQDHLPLNRLERVFARGGMAISRKTLCDWVQAVAKLLGPIVLAMKRKLLEALLLQVDESPTPVMDPEVQGKTAKYWLWSYGVPEGEVIFDFARGRGADVPMEFLEDFSGYIQSDGYSVYRSLEKQRGNVRLGCWSHARRKFFEAREEDPEFAKPVLAAIQKLFRLEKRAKTEGLGGAALVKLRREEALPILEVLSSVIDSRKGHYVPESGLGGAIRYARNNWKTLVRYVDVAEAPIANQSAEQSFRPLALGRNNWLFVGHPNAGPNAAIIFSLIESCRRLGADPFTYLKDVIARLAEEPERAPELTPRKWLKAAKSSAAENVATTTAR